MRLLAVETSTLAGGVALLDGERLVAEYLLDVGIAHSERLMAAVDRVLSDARWTMRDLAGLAVAVGPGSFTGLRIAVSTVKGLALALGLPIAAVPTLDAMAAAVPWASLPVVAVLDARKGEVYAARYHWEDGAMRRDWEYAALAPEALALRLSEPTLLIGDGAAVVDQGGLHRRCANIDPQVHSKNPVCAAGTAAWMRRCSVSNRALPAPSKKYFCWRLTVALSFYA
jgi:tRNA threonylcarbamoyladenosine biosynthesis protein TsaB